MLYSLKTDAWKIADFGLTTQGTSNGRYSTIYSKGTAGYRAPELIADPPHFNKKTDIWALGCILFELVVKNKPFTADWNVQEFALSHKEFEFPMTKISIVGDVDTRAIISGLVKQMLQVEGSNRPSAKTLWNSFKDLSASGESGSMRSTGYIKKNRLLRELRYFHSDAWGLGISLGTLDSDLSCLTFFIEGPKTSPYEGLPINNGC